MNTIFDIEQKQDSPEKLAAVAGIPERFYINADEFNDVTRSALESAIDNAEIDFSWSNKPQHQQHNFNNINTIQLLVMDFKESWMLSATDEIWLLIDRYKPKRVVDGSKGKLKASGFKHDIYPDYNNPKRPSEIKITAKEMILNLGQAFYFQNVTSHSVLRAKGFGGRNTIYNNNRAWVYLQFRIRVKKGDKIFYSTPKKTIKMMLTRQNVGGGTYTTISYKIV